MGPIKIAHTCVHNFKIVKQQIKLPEILNIPFAVAIPEFSSQILRNKFNKPIPVCSPIPVCDYNAGTDGAVGRIPGVLDKLSYLVQELAFAF